MSWFSKDKMADDGLIASIGGRMTIEQAEKNAKAVQQAFAAMRLASDAPKSDVDQAGNLSAQGTDHYLQKLNEVKAEFKERKAEAYGNAQRNGPLLNPAEAFDVKTASFDSEFPGSKAFDTIMYRMGEVEQRINSFEKIYISRVESLEIRLREQNEILSSQSRQLVRHERTIEKLEETIQALLLTLDKEAVKVPEVPAHIEVRKKAK